MQKVANICFGSACVCVCIMCVLQRRRRRALASLAATCFIHLKKPLEPHFTVAKIYPLVGLSFSLSRLLLNASAPLMFLSLPFATIYYVQMHLGAIADFSPRTAQTRMRAFSLKLSQVFYSYRLQKFITQLNLHWRGFFIHFGCQHKLSFFFWQE